MFLGQFFCPSMVSRINTSIVQHLSLEVWKQFRAQTILEFLNTLSKTNQIDLYQNILPMNLKISDFVYIY